MLKMSVVMAVALAATSAAAADLKNLGSLSQEAFKQFTADTTSALSYKAVSPGDPLGLLGIDIGVELSATRLSHPEIMQTATGVAREFAMSPRLHVHKGLPLAFDIGAFYAAVPAFDASLYGGEVRWSPFEGTTLTPAVSLRGAFTVLSGSEQLDFHSTSGEIVISKGFLFVKPYLGAGLVYGSAKPGVAGLSDVSVWQRKYFGGVNVNLGLVNMAVEADRTGHDNTYSAKLGFRF
jgi:hypothetical protein